MKFSKWLEEARGKRDTGREFDGGSDTCKCPECGYEAAHRKGLPCNRVKCPKCGSYMSGEKCGQ